MKLKIALFLLVMTIISRVVWHPFGATAALSAGFIAAYLVDKRLSLLLMLMGLLISDTILGLYWGYEIFYKGFYWNYVSLLFLWAVMFYNIKHPWFTIFTMSFVFFLTSNFFVWYAYDMYPHTGYGLMQCYIAGVPFLINNFFGDIIYTGVIVSVMSWAMNLKLKKV